MKKILLPLALLLMVLGISFIVDPSANAVTGFGVCDKIGVETSTCKDVQRQKAAGTNPVIATLKIALNILAFIAGAAAVIMLVVNGLRLILSNGDSSGVSAARSGLIYVVVGLVIAVMAKSIVVFVLDNI